MTGDSQRTEIKKDIKRVCEKIEDVREDISDLDTKVGDIREQLPGDETLQTQANCKDHRQSVMDKITTVRHDLFQKIKANRKLIYAFGGGLVALAGSLFWYMQAGG